MAAPSPAIPRTPIQPRTGKGPSQYEKFDQIVAWLFQQSDEPVKGISSIVDRFVRNFRVSLPRKDEGEQSRTPILQFIAKCDRLARLLHQVVLKVVRIEGEDTPYVLPEKPVAANKQGGEEKKLELVLQHIVSQIDYIFSYMEDDIELLYLYCDMVAVAEAKKAPPEQVSKKVLFVVERAKHVYANLQRLQMFVLVKHNGPDPSLVEDLIGLQQLYQRGWITAEEHQSRELEAIENIVRAYATRGRFLQQQHTELTIRREKPIELPPDLPDAQQQAVAKLRALLDQGFLDTTEYNARASQIITKWQREQAEAAKRREEEERRKQQEMLAAQQRQQEEAARKEAAAKAEQEAKRAREAAAAAAAAQAAASPKEDPVRPSKPVPSTPESPSSSSGNLLVKGASGSLVKSAPEVDKAPRPPSTSNLSRSHGEGSPSLMRRGSTTIPPERTSSSSPLPDAAPRNNDPEAAMAKLQAALQEQAARKSTPNMNALVNNSGAKGSDSRPSTPVPVAATPPPGAQKVTPQMAKVQASSPMAASPGSPQEKRKTSLFSRDKSSSSLASPGDRPSSSMIMTDAPDTPSTPFSAPGSGGSVFDDLSSLQLAAKARHDPDAYRVHMAEKKLGKTKKADMIQLKACVDKTFLTDGHALQVRLGVVNQSKKSVNCVKFILQNASEQTVNEVEDATREVTEGSEPVFPLIKGAWSGEIEYILPAAVAPGAYKFRVQLFYNTRFNIEVPITVHVLTKDAMWKLNPLQVFGVPLEEVQKREGNLIPYAIAGPMRAMCSNLDYMKMEGVFRLSGDQSKIMRIRDQMDSGKQPDFGALLVGQQGAVHNVLGVLKMFVRMLPAPLLTEELYDEFLGALQKTKGQDRAAKVAVYKPLCDRVPEGNRAVLATLCDFFNRFTVPFVDTNKMHHANLAVVFGPVFCWRASLSPMEELSNASRVNGLVKEIIEYADDCFPGFVQPVPGVPPKEGAATVRPNSPRRLLPTAALMAAEMQPIGSPYASPAPTRGASAIRIGGGGGEQQSGTPNSPATKRPVMMGTSRSPRRDESSGTMPTISPRESNNSTPSTAAPKPEKPLPPIPRSAMLGKGAAESQKKGFVMDDEEEEDSL